MPNPETLIRIAESLEAEARQQATAWKRLCAQAKTAGLPDAVLSLFDGACFGASLSAREAAAVVAALDACAIEERLAVGA